MLRAQKERLVHFVLVFAIVVLLLSITFVILTMPEASITGYVTLDELTPQVRTMAQSFPLTQYAGDGAEMCMLIPGDEGNDSMYSYKLTKNFGAVNVQVADSRYCDNDYNNMGPEDFVIKYPSYENFLIDAGNPSCNGFKNSATGLNFYLLPSQYIKQGGDPVCDGQFAATYCPVFKQCLTEVELKSFGLECCMEKGLIQQLPGIFSTGILLTILVIIILAGGAIFGVMVYTKAKAKSKLRETKKQDQYTAQLSNYVKSTLQKGYSKEQVKQGLIQEGWPKDAVNDVLSKF